MRALLEVYIYNTLLDTSAHPSLSCLYRYCETLVTFQNAAW